VNPLDQDDNLWRPCRWWRSWLWPSGDTPVVSAVLQVCSGRT